MNVPEMGHSSYHNDSIENLTLNRSQTLQSHIDSLADYHVVVDTNYLRPRPPAPAAGIIPSTLRGLYLYPSSAHGHPMGHIFSSCNKLPLYKLKELCIDLPQLEPNDSRNKKIMKYLYKFHDLLDPDHWDVLYNFFNKKESFKSKMGRQVKIKVARCAKRISRDIFHMDSDFEAQSETIEFSNFQKLSVVFALLTKDLTISQSAKWSRIATNIGAFCFSDNNTTTLLASTNVLLEIIEYSDLTLDTFKPEQLESLHMTISRVREFFATHEKDRDHFQAQSLTEEFKTLSQENMDVLMRILCTIYGFITNTKVNSLDILGTQWQEALNKAFRATSSFPEILNFLIRVIKTCWEWFQIYVLKTPPDYTRMIKDLDACHDAWVTDLWELEGMYLDREKGVAINPACRRRVLDHYTIGQDLNLLIEKHKTISRNTYSHFMSLFARSSKMADLARAASQTTMFRVPAYMFQFFGGTGVGKTTTINRLAGILNKEFEFGFDEGSLTYTRLQSSKFWEGYAGQMMTLYDDLFQIKDVTTRGEIAEEIIHVRNSSPVSLNMAGVEQKGKVVFSSPFVAVTTNEPETRSIGIACQEAFWRRFNSRWKLHFPDYGLTSDKTPDYAKMQADYPNLSRDEVYFKCLRFKLESTGDNVELNFDQFISYIIQDARDYMSREMQVLTATRNFLEGADVDCVITKNNDGLLPQSINVEVGDEIYAIPIADRDLIEDPAEAQSLADIGLFNIDYKAGFFSSSCAVTPRMIFNATKGKIKSIRNRNYSFSYAPVSDAAVRIKEFTTLSLENRASLFKMLNNPMARPATQVFNYFFGVENTRARQDTLANIDMAILAATGVVCLYTGIKMTFSTVHWAFRPTLVGQSDERTMLNNKRDNRTIKKSGRGKSNFKLKYMDRAQGLSDDNYLGKIQQNMCILTIRESITGHTHTQKGLGISCGTVICASHFVALMETIMLDDPASVIEFQGRTSTKVVSFSDIGMISPDDEDGLDIAMLNFGDKIMQFPSIQKKFMREVDISRVRINECTMMSLVRLPKQQGMVNLVALNDVKYLLESPPYKSDGDIYSVSRAFSYSNYSAAGFCGSVLLHRDSSVEGSIMGVHVAGNPHNSNGISQCVTRENIEDMLVASGVKVERINDISVDPTSDVSKFVKFDNIEFLGQVRHSESITMATKTQLRQSDVFDKIAKHTTMPAMLAAANGISPIMLALNKANIKDGSFNTRIVEEIHTLLVSKYISLPSRNYANTLSYWETLNGKRGTSHLNQINIDSSAGYPYVLHKVRKGKRDMIDQFETTDGPELRFSKSFIAEVKAEEEALSNGICRMFPFIASLKDEKRPILKAMQGKTRMFSAGNVLHLTLCRRYFGGFLAFLTSHNNLLGSKVGVDMTGPEFGDIYKFCTAGRTAEETHTNWLAGDFSAYDDSIMSPLISSFFNAAIEWYAYHHQQDKLFDRADRIRKTLMESFKGPLHVLGPYIFSLSKGNCSGNFATVHINGHVNELIHRYAFQVLGVDYGLDASSFDKYVNLALYGDDSLGNVSSYVGDWYHGESLTKIFREDFGMTYTSATKEQATRFTRREDISFCKRSFVFNDDLHSVVGLLPMPVILEITNWIKDCADPSLATLDNVKFAHSEIFLYGQTEYDKHTKLFIDKCSEQNLEYVPVSYSTLRRRYLKKIA